jgi:putative tricarboxylic transport membrane protein
MAQRIGNLLFISAVGLFGLIYFLDVQRLPEAEERTVVDILFWILLVLLAMEASRTLYLMVKDAKTKVHAVEIKKAKERIQDGLSNKSIILMIFFIIYVMLIPKVGFFVSSFLFVMLLKYYLGSRKLWELVLIPTGLLSIVYLIFVKLLLIKLPPGILF